MNFKFVNHHWATQFSFTAMGITIWWSLSYRQQATGLGSTTPAVYTAWKIPCRLTLLVISLINTGATLFERSFLWTQRKLISTIKTVLKGRKIATRYWKLGDPRVNYVKVSPNESLYGSISVSGQLCTYPSPNPTSYNKVCSSSHCNQVDNQTWFDATLVWKLMNVT